MFFLQLPTPKFEVPPDSVLVNKLADNTKEFFSLSWQEQLQTLTDGLVGLGFNLIKAAIIFFVGRWLIRRIDKLINSIFVRKGVDLSINSFVRNLLKAIGYIIILMMIVAVLGIKTTSFAAILAAAGFAVGMALSGTLQNFAGGVMILLLKPFRIGDFIQAQGQEGTVKEIKLFNTILVTPDNKTIIVPNGGMSTSIINNYSMAGTRRVEWLFNISYGDDYDLAKDIVKKLLENDERVLKKPPYFIAMKALGEHSVNILVRAWTKGSDYWDVFFQMNEKIYKLFPQHGLNIPYNQLDVTLHTAEDPEKMQKQKPTAAAIKKTLDSVDNATKSDDNSITSSDIELYNTPAENIDEESATEKEAVGDSDD